jgi:hypothetical protein
MSVSSVTRVYRVTPSPNHTELCALVRFTLRTDLATKFNMCTTTASAASSVPVRRGSCVTNMSIQWLEGLTAATCRTNGSTGWRSSSCDERSTLPAWSLVEAPFRKSQLRHETSLEIAMLSLVGSLNYCRPDLDFDER